MSEAQKNRTRRVTNPSKPIFQFDTGGRFLREWESIALASRECNIDKKGIQRALKIPTAAGGFVWKHKEGVSDVQEIDVVLPVSNKRQIIAVNIETKVETLYPSVLAAFEATKVHQAMIRYIINGRYTESKGFTFKVAPEQKS